MMLPESRKILRLYVAKAHKLRASTFTKIVQTKPRFGLRFTTHQAIEFDEGGLEWEHIDVIALTLRLFYQQSEPISFKALEKLLGDAGLSPEWKEKYQEARLSLNDFFNLGGNGRIFGRHYTKREIFEVFLYGDLAHTNNREKREIFEQWNEVDLTQHILLVEFIDIVVVFMNHIFYVATASEQELQQAEVGSNE